MKKFVNNDIACAIDLDIRSRLSIAMMGINPDWPYVTKRVYDSVNNATMTHLLTYKKFFGDDLYNKNLFPTFVG
jgi:hypothetical protein